MPTHIVLQGECFSSLAARCGLEPEDLYNHPDNAGLKKKRPYLSILAPGDEIVIPDPNQKTVGVATGQVHKFVVNLRRVKLRLALLNAQGTPHEGKRFVVAVAGKEFNGTTASGGLIECDVPAQEESAHLRVWLDNNDPDPHIDRDFAIGHLDPIDSLTGIQARLANLGYPCDVTGESDQATLFALRRFRDATGLSRQLKSDPSDQTDAGTDANPAEEDANLNTPSDAGEGGQQDAADSPSDVDSLIDDALRNALQGLYEAR